MLISLPLPSHDGTPWTIASPEDLALAAPQRIVERGAGPATLFKSAGGGFQIAAELLTSVEITASHELHVSIKIPSPVPLYSGAPYFTFTLTIKKGDPDWTVHGDPMDWFQLSTQPTSGRLGQWMHHVSQDPNTGPKLGLSMANDQGFPLNELGITQSLTAWGSQSDHEAFMGVFIDANDVAYLVFIPAGTPTTPGNQPVAVINGIGLSGLEDCPLTVPHIGNWKIAPVMLMFALGPTNALRTSSDAAWRCLVNWLPLTTAYGDPLNCLPPTQLLDGLWNASIDRIMPSLRTWLGALPWCPMPSLDIENAPMRPLLLFDIIGGKGAWLRNVLLRPFKPSEPVTARFYWQVSDTNAVGASAPGRMPLPDRGRAGVLELNAQTQADAQSAYGWDQVPLESQIPALLALNISPGVLGQVASWQFIQVRPAPLSSPWIDMGSLELQILPSAAKPDPGDNTLACKLSGQWTNARCDVYPEIDLRVPCNVRLSAGIDPAQRGSAFAEFDAASESDEALHQDTNPVRCLFDPTPRQCRLRLRVRCEHGRNAIVEMQLSSTDQKALRGGSFYLQARPFLVARVSPSATDPQAGELVAIWNSSDPQGPQWRVPDASLSFDLPPQAVAEEMERGSRFWDAANTPYIDPKKALRYRFSPPTRLVLRSSSQDRRYEQNPNNAANVLRDAKVQSFISELVYPLRVSFTVSDKDLPDIRVAESAMLVGKPAVNLPAVPLEKNQRSAWLDSVFAGAFARWIAPQIADATWPVLIAPFAQLRDRHRAVRASFAARVGQYHLRDSTNADGGLRLKEGLKFRIRDGKLGAPPLLNPLPLQPNRADFQQEQMAGLTQPPGSNETCSWFNESGGTYVWGDPDKNGSLRAGLIHTIEFASELISVLSGPEASGGTIDSLSFSALGGTGEMSASFDEGRTIFFAQAHNGQLARLTKIRIGRVALLWNKARHVTVYERSVVPGWQFADEQQDTQASFGWPMLRKMEEYVEPIETVRRFDSVAERESRTDCIEACQFISERVYVNSAWGRDLGDGYEIPLWKPDDAASLYPKPLIALLMNAGGEIGTRGVFKEPHHLYFYTSTARGTGDDSDKWGPVKGVDVPLGLARVPVLLRPKPPEGVARAQVIPFGNTDVLRRKRFDLAISSEGAANLQHGRSDERLLAKLDVVTLARTQETSAPKDLDPSTRPLSDWTQLASHVKGAADRLDMLARHIGDQLLNSSLSCDTLKQQLLADIDEAFNDATGLLNQFDPQSLFKSFKDQWTRAAAGALGDAGTLVARAWSDVLMQFQTGVATQLMVFEQQVAIPTPFGEPRDTLIAQLNALNALIANSFTSLERTCRQKLVLLKWPDQDLTHLVKPLHDAVFALECKQGQGGPDTNNWKDARLAVVAAARTMQQVLPGAFDGSLVQCIASVLCQLIAQVEGTLDHELPWESFTCAVLTPMAASLRDIVIGVETVLATGKAAWKSVEDKVGDWVSALEDRYALVKQKAGQNLDLLSTATSALQVSAACDKFNRQLLAAIQSDAAIVGNAANSIDSQIVSALNAIQAPMSGAIDGLLPLINALRGKSTAAIQLLDSYRDKVRGEIEAVACPFDRNALFAAVTGVQQTLESTQDAISRGVTGVIDAFSSTAAQGALDALETIAAQPGQGLKFIKAIGDLPVMPPLIGNAWKAEYVKDDIEKAIATSPYAVRLRDVAAGLNELGLTLPTNRLLDSFVPDVKDANFGDIFRNVAGINFEDFFARFRIVDLTPEQVKLSHGVDPTSGSAWVKSVVNANFPQEQTLFEIASAAVRVSKMALRASSDLEIAASGERRAVTNGSFQADWGLDFGGTRLATFQDVTVQFDGSSFSFDVSPDKVSLHPTLQFVQDYVKAFGESLPPGVQIDKDSRGMPVGARASYDMQTGQLPPLGPLLIGPMQISAGIGLRLQDDGKFRVVTQVAVGAESAPVFVQIGYLGGGMWLEAQAVATGRDIVPSATIGLALGAMRSIDLAGVARGSFSVLLFVDAQIDVHGGAFQAGLSIQGSARILGIASASVYLLLEVNHQADGSTIGTGFLDVEVEICWCFTLHVHQATTHTISS